MRREDATCEIKWLSSNNPPKIKDYKECPCYLAAKVADEL